MTARIDEDDLTAAPDHDRGSGRRRRRFLAAQAAASAGGLMSLTAVLLGTPALATQAHAVRASHSTVVSESGSGGISGLSTRVG